MESGAISDEQVSASSELDAYNSAPQGRLFYPGNQTHKAAWVPASNDENQWLQVDLRSYYKQVTRVATQGRHDSSVQWVTEYNLEFGDDGLNFQYYVERGQNVLKVVMMMIIRIIRIRIISGIQIALLFHRLKALYNSTDYSNSNASFRTQDTIRT